MINKLTRIQVTAFLLLGLAILMIGAAYASVPLYKIFCQVTGFGGTTQRSIAAPLEKSDRKILIQFDSNIQPSLGWDFYPTQREIEVNVGESSIAFYTAKNTTNSTLKGTAVFNVTPVKAGYFFNKIDCFCFSDQILSPGEEMQMPVTFFIDPEINMDKNLNDIKVITLSYTFFEKKETAQENISSLKKIKKSMILDFVLDNEMKGG
ncbi:cytochrome c oxidase assembly protein [Alphaproteobacteria bacterium]|nr:cytochrome c oxidase assembly protein [Alphaproteobacteria bacterium]